MTSSVRSVAHEWPWKTDQVWRTSATAILFFLKARGPEGSTGYLFIYCSEFSCGTSRGFILSLFLGDTCLIHCEDCDGLCVTVLPVHWWHFDLCDFFRWAGEKRIIFVLFFTNKKIDKGEYSLLNFITAKKCAYRY